MDFQSLLDMDAQLMLEKVAEVGFTRSCAEFGLKNKVEKELRVYLLKQGFDITPYTTKLQTFYYLIILKFQKARGLNPNL